MECDDLPGPRRRHSPYYDAVKEEVDCEERDGFLAHAKREDARTQRKPWHDQRLNKLIGTQELDCLAPMSEQEAHGPEKCQDPPKQDEPH